MYVPIAPLPSSSSLFFTPQRQKNLKDVMKTPTSILLSSTILETCASEEREKKKKKKSKTIFPDNILPVTLGI